MFAWLQTLPEWEEVLVLIFLAIISLGALFLLGLALIRGGLHVRGGKVTVDVDAQGKKVVKRRSPHAGCKNVTDIILVLKKVAEVGEKVFIIKYVDTMREQMIYCENRAIVLRGLIQKVFLGALSDLIRSSGKDVDDLIGHRDYKYYSLCLDKLFVTILAYIKASLGENHYTDISEVDFDRYASEKCDAILQMAIDLLNTVYDGHELTRPMLYQANMANSDSMRSLTYDMFLNARRITQEKVKLMEVLEIEKDKYIEDILGVEF